MLSRGGRILFVVWIAWLILAWINASTPAWPLPVSVSDLVPFSKGSGHPGWYDWALLALWGAAGWRIWRFMRQDRT